MIMLGFCTGFNGASHYPINKWEEGNKQIEAQKPLVPHGTVLLLGSDPRTSSMFKGKRPSV